MLINARVGKNIKMWERLMSTLKITTLKFLLNLETTDDQSSNRFNTFNAEHNL